MSITLAIVIGAAIGIVLDLFVFYDLYVKKTDGEMTELLALVFGLGSVVCMVICPPLATAGYVAFALPWVPKLLKSTLSALKQMWIHVTER